jgi:hypothetical protein
MDNEPAQTILVILAALAYGAVASGCVIRTLFEGYAARARWDAWRVLGLVACFVWPILFLAPLAQILTGSSAASKPARRIHSARRDLDRTTSERVSSNG